MVEDKITCPQCNAATEVTPTAVILPDSSALQQLFAGALNRICCESCHTVFLYETPLLYRDDARKVLIYYNPESAGQIDDAVATINTLQQTMWSALTNDQQPTCRLVVSRQTFIEKISIVQRHLDDRLIEFAKYQLLQHSSGLAPDVFELLFDFESSDDESLAFLAFNRETGQVQYTLSLRQQEYEALYAHFKAPERQIELTSYFNDCYVSVDYLCGMNVTSAPQ